MYSLHIKGLYYNELMIVIINHMLLNYIVVSLKYDHIDHYHIHTRGPININFYFAYSMNTEKEKYWIIKSDIIALCTNMKNSTRKTPEGKTAHT